MTRVNVGERHAESRRVEELLKRYGVSRRNDMETARGLFGGG